VRDSTSGFTPELDILNIVEEIIGDFYISKEYGFEIRKVLGSREGISVRE
jgi:hypothetical protein